MVTLVRSYAVKIRINQKLFNNVYFKRIFELLVTLRPNKPDVLLNVDLSTHQMEQENRKSKL